jgi:hypothetical protein
VHIIVMEENHHENDRKHTKSKKHDVHVLPSQMDHDRSVGLSGLSKMKNSSLEMHETLPGQWQTGGGLLLWQPSQMGKWSETADC